MKTKLLVAFMVVALLQLCLAGCGASPAALPPSPTPVPPTSTPAPSPWVEGVLIDKDTDQPLGNARVELCQQQDQSTCMVKADLTSVSDGNGKYKILDVPNGKFAILYNASGKSLPLEKLQILNYTPEAAAPSSGVANLDNLMKSLKISSISLCNAYYEVVDGNLVVSGYVYASSLDVGFMFVKGDMVYATIDNSPASLNLRVWDTQNADKCDGGEFKPLP
jgi:predicted small lipoprotein YifL